MYDVLIVGCGVVGAAAAYELSKYDLKVCVCERYNDVANGCTKANTAVLHAGFDCPVGSMEAKLNVKGIQLAKEICEKLDVERIPMPTFIVAYDNKHDLDYIQELYRRGIANGVPGIRIVDHDEALKLEPGLNPNLKAALYAPSSAIINPWEYAIAMAETAVRNGCDLKLSSKVTAIEKTGDIFKVTTESGVYEARYVINAGGGWSAQVNELIGDKSLHQTNFAGQYYVLDKSQNEKIHSIVFPTPDEHGFKGICVIPTVHGNVLVGPDAYVVPDGDHVGTDPKTLELLKGEAEKSVPGLDFREVIHEYAGVRPNTQIPDFVIGEHKTVKHFIQLAGIKSPGLSAAPAIAQEALDILKGCGLELHRKDNYIDERKVVRFRKCSNEERAELIKQNPLYGRIICRCETVTEAEIVDAIHSPIPPTTVDAIKRRCNPGMGRCQGGFCGPRVHEILARELKMSPKDILMDEQGTYIITSAIKEADHE